MLVTPLSEAPTPMPPTPPPTPVPQDVEVTVTFVVAKATDFDMIKTLKALGVDTNAIATAVFAVEVTSTISPIPTLDEAKDLYALIFVGIPKDKITVTITEIGAAAGVCRAQT